VTSTGAAGTSFSKERIELLCDGIFAIAMTLLVLELKVPAGLDKHASAAEIWSALRQEGLSFFGYFLTFGLAGQFWILHHILFHYLTHATRALALLSIVMLMFVALLPFSTSMFVHFGVRQPVSLAIYFGNQFVLALLVAVQWVVARQQGLVGGEDTPIRRRHTFMFLGLPVVFGVVTVAAFLAAESVAWVALFGLLVIRIASRRKT